MKRKIIGIFVIVLMISSAMTTILFSDNGKVEASGGEQQSSQDIGLDFEFVWNMTDNFSKVIYRTDWSSENNIPKGRSWATAGENYTIARILKPAMDGPSSPCGLTNYTNLTIGFIEGSHEPLHPLRPKQYSSKIVVHDYRLTLYNHSELYLDIPYNELFPIAVGDRVPIIYPLTHNYSFGSSLVKEISLFPWDYIQDHCNISCDTFNSSQPLGGKVVFINNNETIPEDQGSLVFILEEEPSCEEKIKNMTGASGVILIENETREYTFQNYSLVDIPITKVAGSDSNLTIVFNEVTNGSTFVVENVMNNHTLVFSNFSNDSCFPLQGWLGVIKRLAPSDPNAYTLLGKNGAYYDFVRLTIWEKISRYAPRCNGSILSDFTDTHFMTHSVSNWGWFSDAFSNRWYLPTFSVNKSIGHYLINNSDTATVSGFIDQEYRQQNNTTPGVISNNVVAYLNISQNPHAPITVVSSRMDGWWSETPGDSGIGCAMVLGIAKYFKDNNITPKNNLMFLFTTGEEYGMRGAQHFVDSHPYGTGEGEYNFVHFIGFDQLGFNYTTSTSKKISLEINTKDATMQNIVSAIADQTNYQKRTNNTYDLFVSDEPGGGSEDKVWKDHCEKTICFGKDSAWDGYHRAGMNFSRGDSLNYIDRNDVNVTFELAWNVTKYFTVNPNCWFNNTPTHQMWDSNHDAINDSANISFSIKSILPYDRIWVKATLVSKKNPRLCRFSTEKNYIINSSGIEDTLTVTLPRNAPQDWYYLKVYLYNSTGEIDRKCHYPLTNYWDYKLGSKYSNDTYEQGPYQMYPANLPPLTPEQPQGNDDVLAGIPHFYTTSTTDPEKDPIWYKWKYETSLGEFTSFWRGPYESGEEATKMFSWVFPGIYNVSARAKYLLNPNVMSNWSEALPVNVSPWFEGPVEWNTDLLDDLSQTMVAIGQQTSSNGFAQGINVKSSTRDSLNWTWEYGDGNVSYGEAAAHSYNKVGNYTVILRIRNSQGYYYNCSKNVTVILLNAGFTTSGDIQAGKTALFNDTSAGVNQIVNWTWYFGDGNISYQRNTSHVYAANGMYNVTLIVRDAENNTHSVLQQVIVETTPPAFIHVAAEPEVVGFGSPVTISTDLYEDYVENQSGIRDIWVNITYPDNTTQSFQMNLNASSEHDYTFTFNDTWQPGIYNYSIYVVDNANNTNCTGLNFTVSAEATIMVSTTKNSYTGTQYINLTDPPGAPLPSLGYELLDDGAVLHLWNQYDSYYFNTTSGIQLTNHKDDYWSHNVLMLGYYNNDQWNLLYRTDELTEFIKNIETDGASFVNVTLWKDLSYGGYSFRLAIRYHLGVNDNDLTVIPYIKNIGANNIPYTLGFGWELKDIEINMTSSGDYIMVDQGMYFLNQTLNKVYTDLDDPMFNIMENVTDSQTFSLYLRWDPNIPYKLQVKSRAGQENAPVTLFIRVGTLFAGQQKHTMLQWYDASQETYYFNTYGEKEAWETNPDLMTDETEETFASTSVNNDVELCNGNTCPGDDLGTILKVELQVHGYYEGKNQGSISLRPVFKDGELDGENYTFVASDQPEWSEWFDITDDGGHGSGQWRTPWSWSEFTTLDCDVKASLGSETTLFCSMVQLRVTYNTAPAVSNPYPIYGTNGITVQPRLNITVSDPDGDSMNVTWYSNSTPSLLVLRPNANGSSTQLTKYPSSIPANYMCVDETVANDSDYVKWQGITWMKDTYNIQNHGSTSGVIHDVTVYARCARGGGAMYDPGVPNAGKIAIRSAGSYYYGNEFTLPSPFTYYSYTWHVNPATSTAWNWSAIDNLEAGIALNGNELGYSKCSQVYVVVNHTDPSTWLQFGRNSSVNNGVYHQRFLNASVNGEWWYWKVKADDGTASTWSSVYKFYTGYQSKIENIGETNINGFLLMQVQFYNTSQGKWLVDRDTINETFTRTINSGGQLPLDAIFNGHVRASDLTQVVGTYRVYAAFRDPVGNILKTNSGVELKAWWQFSKT